MREIALPGRQRGKGSIVFVSSFTATAFSVIGGTLTAVMALVLPSIALI
jgi:hypothetical protein